MAPQRLGQETCTFSSLIDSADQMHNKTYESKYKTGDMAKLLLKEAFLDVSQFQVFLDDQNKPVKTFPRPIRTGGHLLWSCKCFKAQIPCSQMTLLCQSFCRSGVEGEVG